MTAFPPTCTGLPRHPEKFMQAPSNVTIWAALAAAVASIVAAGFSLFGALRSSRIKSESDLALEKFKAADATRRRAFDLALAESEPLVAALGQAWSDLQVIREVIHKVVAPARFSESLALKTLSAASGSIGSGYLRFGSKLPHDVEVVWHSAKNRVLLIDALVREHGGGAEPQEGARPDINERLLQIRAALRDDQTALQEASLNIRAELMKRIVEAM
jgi:hypothetical protein